MTRIAAVCSALLLACALAQAHSGETDSGETDSGDTDTSGVAQGAAQLSGDEGGPAACGCGAGPAGVGWLSLMVVGASTARRRLRRPSGPTAP